jgi:hypothetical protein
MRSHSQRRQKNRQFISNLAEKYAEILQLVDELKLHHSA